MSVLDIKNLEVSINEKQILKGLNLEIKSGEIHAVMGPNGAGKSTLASAIMGHPKYEVDGGSILLDGEEVLEMEVDERARAGLFLAMQYPSEVPGVPTSEFIKSAINAQREDSIPLMQYIKKLDKTMEFLEMDLKMSQRYVNDGFSGGEKKRNEILQMMMLEPKFTARETPAVFPKVSEIALPAVLVTAFPTVLAMVLPVESETEVPLFQEWLYSACAI